MFDPKSEEFRNQVLDLSNQISVFRRLIVAQNKEIINEEERYRNQIKNGNENIETLSSIHYSYMRDSKAHIDREIKSELLYLNVIASSYNNARKRAVELAKKIKEVQSPEEKKALKDEIKLVLPFVNIYEEYRKELLSMQDAVKGFEQNNDRYVDYIKSNIDNFETVKDEVKKAKENAKDKEFNFDVTINEKGLGILPSFDNIKLEKPEILNLDTLVPEEIDYIYLSFIEGVSKNTNIPVEELETKKINLKINGSVIKNITKDSFTNTILKYVDNYKKDKKESEIKEKTKKEVEDSKVPDKKSENEKSAESKEVKKKNQIPATHVDDVIKADIIVTLDSILADLTKGLDLKKGDDWKFHASNIRVNKNFKNKVCTGNKLYNIVALAPSIISYPFQLIHKGIGKLSYTKKVDDRVSILSERLANLSERELDILYRNYKGGNLRNYQKMPIVNSLIQQRICAWINEKIKDINTKLITKYNKILVDYKKMCNIAKKLNNDSKLTDEEYDSLLDEYFALAKGKAELIGEYVNLCNEKLDYEIGGKVGFKESINAYKSGMSQAGFRFRKVTKEDDKLNEEQAKAYNDQIKGILNNDDLLALSGFVRREKLLSDNSIINVSFLMDRDVGRRSHNPFIHQLNYQKDPFVSDLMRSVVLVASGINIYNTIQRVNELDNLKEIVGTQQEQINILNADLDKAKQLGESISDKSDAVINGRVAQINEANLANMNTMERATLDKMNWNTTGAEYRALDDATHAAYNSAYQYSQAQINSIADEVANGSISQAEAMSKLTSLSNEMEEQFIENYTNVKSIVEEYAASHQQFDLSAPNEGLGKVIDTGANINISNEAIDEAFKVANEISNIKGVSLEDIEALTANIAKIEAEVGTNVIPSLTSSISAAILALGVKNRMKKYGAYDYAYYAENPSEIAQEDIDAYEEFLSGIDSNIEEKGRTMSA